MHEHQKTASDRVPLRGHRAHSRTTIHGWPALLFGLPFGGAGCAITLVATGWIEAPKASIHAPMWVIGIMGAAFLAAGAWLVTHGAQGITRRSLLRAEKVRRPGSPWLWDYAWQPKGTSENKLGEVLHAMGTLAVFAVFLAPFNWVAFYSQHESFFWWAIVGFFDLVILLGVGSYCFRKVVQALKYGSSRVRFHGFPFVLGGTMRLAVEGLPKQARAIHFTLRFIEEAYEIKGSGRNKRSEVVCYQRYHDSRTASPREIGPYGRLEIEWALPDDPALTSRLSDRPAKFWEIEIVGEAPGVDYECRFLLPVYARAS